MRQNPPAHANRSTQRLLRWMLLAFLCLPATAFGQVNAKTAVTMMQQAAKAYEAGDFVKAAEWYGKAWRLDPLPAYLWALARAEHLGAMFEPAAEHYRQFIALPGADLAKVAKAQQYLLEAEAELITAQTRAAETAMQSGKPALAAELYLNALKVMPTRLDLLFKAAVAEQMAEQWQAALAHFEDYLARAPVDAPDRVQAVARQGWLRQKLGLAPQAIAPAPAIRLPVAKPAKIPEPAVEQPKPVQPSVVVKGPSPIPTRAVDTVVVQKPAERPTWPGWTLIGSGAALVGGGIVLLVGGRSDAAAVNASQQHGPGEPISSLTYDQAAAQVSSANMRMGVGAALAGAGVAAAGVGAWLLLKTDDRHAMVLPTSNGAIWLVQF